MADSLQEAIARVKADLGRNAIILHTKQFKEGGFLGFFAQRRFEVIAAIDENPSPVISPVIAKTDPAPVSKPSEPAVFVPLNPPATPPPLIAKSPATAVTKPKTELVNCSGEQANLPVSQTGAALQPLNSINPEAAAARESGLDALREELAEMKEILRQAAQKPAVIVRESKGENQLEFQLRERLTQLGLERQVIADLINESPLKFRSGNGNLTEWLNWCQQVLAAKLMFSEPLETDTNTKQQVIALIGPTGVGKTTTIAKLAANVSLFEKKKVGLITIDTYRIAAVEHLKTYGDIMNLTVEVVYTPADLEKAIANLNECDVILIDTAGRSPRNQAMMEELRKFIAKPVIETILLVISATTQYRDMAVIEQTFSRIAYTHLLFTKLDETSSLGPIVSLAWNCKRPISYLTVGQNVPDDIVVAKPDQLIAHLFKGF